MNDNRTLIQLLRDAANYIEDAACEAPFLMRAQAVHRALALRARADYLVILLEKARDPWERDVLRLAIDHPSATLEAPAPREVAAKPKRKKATRPRPPTGRD